MARFGCAKTGEIPKFDDNVLMLIFKYLKPALDKNKKEISYGREKDV